MCVWVVPISTRYGVQRLMWQQNTFDFNLFGPCTCERKALMLAPLGMLKQDNRAVWQTVTSQGLGHSCGEHFLLGEGDARDAVGGFLDKCAATG